jgi:S-DNA-T family DNA segregation ATPase FtsK/SpoIIIE
MSRQAPRPEEAGPSTGLIYAVVHWREWLLVAVAEWFVRHWRLWLLLLAAAVMGVWAGSWLAAIGVLLLPLMVRLLRRKRSPKTTDWWSHGTLSKALVDAGILKATGKATKQGDPILPTLSYRGKPVHTEHGTTVVVGLPDARTLTDVTNRRTNLAAALRVPSSRLEVHQDPEDPANVVRIHVTNGKQGEVRAEVATAPSTDWRDPIRIGVDTRGVPVRLENDEHNSLFAGMPGMGKTSLGRFRLAHYLLDPSTSVFLLDGKGSVKDYGACRGMLAGYVSGVEDNAVQDLLAMLEQVLAEVRRRNAAGGAHPGWLLLLEEYQDPRAAATREQRDRLDTALARIIRMGRAVAVHVKILTQRPSVDDIPASARNLVDQRVCLKLRNAADASLVLGTAPGLDLPKGRGQAIYTDGGEPTAVTLDRLTDADWPGCARER